MKWRKCLEPEALYLLAYMLLTYFYTLTGHLEIAMAYALLVSAHLKHLTTK
jgi:hypothetical protein